MDIDSAASALASARRVVVLTGAGVSADSGVPTFRDDLTGLWARFDPEELATPEAFNRDPELVWGWYEWRRHRVLRADPNPAHAAIATIMARAPETTLVTQNVDDLHERASIGVGRGGSVIHLHGSLFAPRCSVCGASAPVPELVEQPPQGQRLPPPRCVDCGGLVRPGVVWFGERLPEESLTAATQAVVSCDVMVVVGTTGVVYPAAELPRLAARDGATVIQVNLAETALDGVATINLRGSAAEVLPRLVAAAWR